MRHMIAIAALVAGLAFPGHAAAQTDPPFTNIVGVVTIPPGGTSLSVQLCPSGYVPVGRTDPNPFPDQVTNAYQLIDNAGLLLDPSADDFGGRAVGGGFRIETDNGRNEFYRALYMQRCARQGDLNWTELRHSRSIQPGPTNFFSLSCPSDRVPIGFLSNADGTTLQERSYTPLIGASRTPINAIADGDYVPGPDAGFGFRNLTTAPLVLNLTVFCATLPGAEINVVSVPVIDGQPHEVFYGVPDDKTLVGNAFAVSGGVQNDLTLWIDDRLTYEGDFTVTSEEFRAWYLKGIGQAPSPLKQTVVGRAIIGSLTIPAATPAPAPTIIPAVEFYHAGLDHYFVTAIANEIADLDGGVHAGWQRTGESFNVYATRSSGRTGRRPVCRAYGNPAAGLDSHFYSASPSECKATLDNFGDDWLLEASDVFEIELPDTSTGACAVDRIPIYRLWNGRADSSHRFVKTLALRAQMIARGFISEGYGPNGVVFCALS